MMMHCLLNMTYHSLSQSLLWFGQQRLAGSHWLQKAVCNRRPSHSSCRRFEGSHVVSFFPGTAPEHHPSLLVYIRAERDPRNAMGGGRRDRPPPSWHPGAPVLPGASFWVIRRRLWFQRKLCLCPAVRVGGTPPPTGFSHVP